MLKQFLDVMYPGERVVIIDRFRRVIEQTTVNDVSEYLKRCDVDEMHYSALYGCIAFNLNVGKFE